MRLSPYLDASVFRNLGDVSCDASYIPIRNSRSGVSSCVPRKERKIVAIDETLRWVMRRDIL